MFRSVPFCGPKNTRSSFQAMGMLKTNWPSGNTPAWLKSQSWLAIHAVSYTWLWVQTDRQSSLPQLMRHSGCGIVLWWTQLSRKRASPVLHRVQLSDKGFDELLQDSIQCSRTLVKRNNILFMLLVDKICQLLSVTYDPYCKYSMAFWQLLLKSGLCLRCFWGYLVCNVEYVIKTLGTCRSYTRDE